MVSSGHLEQIPLFLGLRFKKPQRNKSHSGVFFGVWSTYLGTLPMYPWVGHQASENNDSLNRWSGGFSPESPIFNARVSYGTDRSDR